VATHHSPIHISLMDPNQYPCRPQPPSVLPLPAGL
jgi:hypothetical protein